MSAGTISAPQWGQYSMDEEFDGMGGGDRDCGDQPTRSILQPPRITLCQTLVRHWLTNSAFSRMTKCKHSPLIRRIRLH